MALIDELKEKRANCLHYIDGREAQIAGHQAALADIRTHLADLDTAIAALEPAPEEHLAPFADTDNFSFWEVRWDFSAGYYDCQRYAVEADALAAFDVLHTATLYKFDPDTGYVELGRKSKHVVPAQAPAQPPSAELRSVTPATEEECGDHIEASVQSEPVGSLQDETEMPSSPGEGEESRDQFDDEPESGLHADPEPTELDAPTSIVDDPELLAAVARAEATLAQEEPAYVGLQDPELDAEYDAMKERERADRKLHFSIFGMKREDA